MLFELAFVDGVFHPQEEIYLIKVFQELGLSAVELEEMKKGKFHYQYELPKEENERIKILYHLLLLSKTDDEISDPEIQYMRSVALKLGLRESLANDLAAVFQEHIGKFLHPDKLLNVLKKYYN